VTEENVEKTLWEMELLTNDARYMIASVLIEKLEAFTGGGGGGGGDGGTSSCSRDGVREVIRERMKGPLREVVEMSRRRAREGLEAIEELDEVRE